MTQSSQWLTYLWTKWHQAIAAKNWTEAADVARSIQMLSEGEE